MYGGLGVDLASLANIDFEDEDEGFFLPSPLAVADDDDNCGFCLLYTSPSPRD